MSRGDAAFFFGKFSRPRNQIGVSVMPELEIFGVMATDIPPKSGSIFSKKV